MIRRIPPQKHKTTPGKRGPKPMDPAKKRVVKTYRLAPLTIRKILRHQVTSGIATEVGALESMLAPYEPRK